MEITVCRPPLSILLLKILTVEELSILSDIISHTFEVKKFSDFRPYLVVFVEDLMKSVCVRGF